MTESLTIAWNDKWNTGEPFVDTQHKYLVSTINELAEAIESGKGQRQIGEILLVAQYYAEWHFEQEENCMERYKCPMAGVNQNAHAHFLKIFEAYRMEYRSTGGSDALAQRIYKDLMDWLVNHIMKIDMRISDCLPQ